MDSVMDTVTVFAIDRNGNHFAEEYVTNSKESALELFHEEHQEAKPLFLVEGSPIYVHL